MKLWSKQLKLDNDTVQTLQSNTLSYGSRSSDFIKKEIHTIIEIIINKCYDEAKYGNSNTSITIDEIEEEYFESYRDNKMLHSIIFKTPNRIKRHIKEFMNNIGFNTYWLEDTFMIRWCEDIKMSD